ncbi:MAG TPA: O-antigen ligase family protein, partial [Solirubrobacteraceae bacterium]|nr:O-antigen ligase family protein [Solirubrobacteraceae bacterium]
MPETSAAEGARNGGNQREAAALLAGSAVLTIYLGFEAGGYFPGSTAVAAIGVAIALVLRIGLAPDPFSGLSWRSGLAAGSLALLAVWTLVSATWSHAPGRAVLEFDRVLLYLLVLVLFASLRRRRGSRTALAGGFAAGAFVLCAAALATRTLPAVFPIRPEIANDRLAFPLTYWNALGLLAALGILLSIGLSASERLPRALRALAAAAIPILTATLVLTFSRGAIAAGLVGLLVLGATCRTRALLLTLVVAVPAAALAAAVAYSATALATATPTGPAAVSQGHHVALVVGLAAVGSAVLRALLVRFDPRADEQGPRLDGRTRRALAALAVVVVVAGGGGAAAAFDLPDALSRQYVAFVKNEQLKPGQPIRARLLNPANTGRLSAWRVAVHTWKSETFHGTGAGTYQNEWNRQRDDNQDLVNAHSLYLEVLSDLGLVGLVLLAVCLATLASGVATRVKGSDRAIGASLLAAGACWLLHAGVDWDWQMPVISWWLFAAGGLGLARTGRSRVRAVGVPGRFARVIVMLGIALVVLLPVQAGLSQVNL